MGKRAFMNVTEVLGLDKIGSPAPEGASEPVGMARPNASTAHKSIRLGIDVPLLLITATLLIFGLLMVYSASSDFSFRNYGDSTYIFRRQLMWGGLGVVLSGAAAWVNYHFLRKISVLMMLGIIIALLLVLLFPNERNGANRTLFGGSVQPSEFAKLATVIYLSVWLYSRRDQIHDWTFGIIPLGVILGVVAGLIGLEPDLSAMVTIVALGVVLFFMAGGELRQIGSLLILGFIAGLIMVNLPFSFIQTGKYRIETWWVGINNPLDSTPQVQRSIEAFVKGGWIGVGIGKSTTKLTGLPVPHTDSIFAVIGEETGVLGCAALILLYLGLFWRGIKISMRAPDGMGKLLAAGLAFWLLTEAIVNMAVMVGLVPVAGNALPFISAGGSNLTASLIAVGIMLNVSRQAEYNQEQQERSFNAVVDLRGRDRRRRVSRSGRPASVEPRQ